MNRHEHRLGIAMVSGSAVAWSLGGLFTRLITVDTWTMIAWRGIFGSAGLAVVLAALRQTDLARKLKTMGWIGWLFVAQSALGMICYQAALGRTSVANVAVIYATAPFLAAALGWIVLRERPNASAIVASIAALAGVCIMVGFGGMGSWLGDLLAFGMTLSMAIATVVVRNFSGIPIPLTACVSSLLSAVICWPLGTPLAVSGRDLALLALFGIVNFAIGLPLFVLGARRLPAIETALVGAVDAPLAPLWVWLAFRETPGAGTLLGGAIVFAAVAIHLGIGESKALAPFAWFRRPAPPGAG